MDNKVFSKVFMWMFIGLFITFVTGFYVSINPNMIYNIFNGPIFIILLIAQIGLVVYLSARINKMNTITAKCVYIFYTILTGVTFSSLFIAYEMASLIYVFGITAIIFGVFAAIGYYTNVDLTKMGSFLIMGLFGLIISYIINFFFMNNTLSMISLFFGIILFLGFILYDIQKIKNMAYNIPDEEKFAIIGALQLYLDFINLFVRLIRLFGKRRN